MELPAIDSCIPRARGRISKWFGLTILKLLGWKVTGDFPAQQKMVVAVAPHTSNWDFIITISVVLALNLQIKFMAKSALFTFPLKKLMLSLGGVPIDRNAKNGTVMQMVQQFSDQEQLILAIAPEGTRSKTRQWKSGFLRIASKANVPLLPVSIDYQKKEVHFLDLVTVSDNIDEELYRFKQNYNEVCAKNPQAV